MLKRASKARRCKAIARADRSHQVSMRTRQLCGAGPYWCQVIPFKSAYYTCLSSIAMFYMHGCSTDGPSAPSLSPSCFVHRCDARPLDDFRLLLLYCSKCDSCVESQLLALARADLPPCCKASTILATILSNRQTFLLTMNKVRIYAILLCKRVLTSLHMC